MEQTSVQTEKIATYENARTKRSLVEDEDSNNDEEFETSGFYVREKTTEKSADVDNLNSSNECEENSTSGSVESEISNNKSASLVESEISASNTADSEVEETEKQNHAESNLNDETIETANENEDKTAAKEDETAHDNKDKTASEEHTGNSNEIDDDSEKKTETEDECNVTETDKARSEGREESDNTASSSSVVETPTEDAEANENSEDANKEDTIEAPEETAENDKKEVEGSKSETEENDNTKKAENDKKEAEDSKSGTEEKDNSKKTETNKKEVESSKRETEETKDVENSILKRQLAKTPLDGANSEEPDNEDMDDDFDPSLLCPDISMDVVEAPVITNTGNAPNDGCVSPLPYEPTFSTLVDEMTGAEVSFDLTPEEMNIRSRIFGKDNPIQFSKIHCTACNVHLGSALDGQKNRFVHPLLKVLICKNCYHFYTSGEFEKDEDGSELYCRWCGQGGEVLCCSSCEFVFCRKCIRNNFGMKKFKEIRNSDDWNCFRCDPAQLAILRASCAEFMDYYTTQLAMASTMVDKMPEVMTKDYTTCCSKPKKKEDKPVHEVKRRKRKLSTEDPDYMPVVDQDEPPKKIIKAMVNPGPGVVSRPSLVPIAPRPLAPSSFVYGAPRAQAPGPSVFRVGTTMFRAKSAPGGFAGSRTPLVQNVRVSSPGYIKILPQRATAPHTQGHSYTVLSGNNRPAMTTVRASFVGNQRPSAAPNPVKHDWFEKTVRAAARVNSNLSYTLTQLNRQQSLANNVEALAVVHNKLQEVLSTSINTLIQVRKNLRTEFIAGIKNIRFPTKSQPAAGPAKDDDDVIFVSPTTISSSVPPPLILSSAITLTSISKQPVKSPALTPTSTTSSSSVTAPAPPSRGGYLKVKSFSALQNVPSDCITIPDDPPIPPTSILDEKTGFVTDPLEDPLELDDKSAKSNDNAVVVLDSSSDDRTPSPKRKSPRDKLNADSFVYDVKEEPTPEVKKMMGAVVVVTRSKEVDEIVGAGKLLNGQKCDNSEEL